MLMQRADDPQRAPIVLSERSSGVTVSYVANPAHIATKACLAELALEEVFSSETTIIRGTVNYIDNIEIDFNGEKSYRAIAGIYVDKVLQGEVNEGDLVRILLPCAITGSVNQSATEIIAQLKPGMEGIFLPKAYAEDSIWEQNGVTLCVRDIAPYGLWDGMRWVFLDTDHGLIFAKFFYEDIAAAGTLDQIETYIREMLEK